MESLILTQFQILLMHPNHSTLIIYAICLKFYILKILYETSIITLWFDLSNMDEGLQRIYILKRKLWICYKNNNWWSLLCEVLLLSMTLMEDTVFFFFFFFLVLYIYVCCIPNYTMFVYLLQFKKIISFSYKKDLVSRCVCIDIKVDNFVYLWFEFILTE